MGVGEESERRALNQRHIASLFPQPHLVPIDKQKMPVFSLMNGPPAPGILIERLATKSPLRDSGDYGEEGAMTGTCFGGPNSWNVL